LDGLQVKPVIPPDWSGFEAVRNFRGVRYEIAVKREGAGNQVSLEVDGKSIDGTIIPLPEVDTKVIKVTAVIR
jgi:cellobiose phosphorylase